MSKIADHTDESPELGLFLLVIVILLLLFIRHGAPEKERELKDKLQEKKCALEILVLNIDEAKQFRNQLLKDIQKTKTITRWIIFGILLSINLLLFLILGYHLNLKEIIECTAIANPTMFTLVYLFFFLRYGEFVEIKNAYQDLQTYILKLRYDKTEEQIDAYLTENLEDKNTLHTEIEEIELQLKHIEEARTLFMQPLLNRQNPNA